MNPQTMLRAAEGAAIQARKNNSSAIQPDNSSNGSEGGLYHNDTEPLRKSKNPFKGRKSKGFVAAALIMLLLLFGAGALVASSPLNIIGMMMSNLTDASDMQYPGNLIRAQKIVPSASRGEIDLGEELTEKLRNEGIDTDNITTDQINNDANYRNTINKTLNIRAMGYYDSVANKYYAARSKGGNLRNKFQNFEATDNLEKDTKEYRDTMENMFDSNPGQTGTTWREKYKEKETYTETDENGNTVTKTREVTKERDAQYHQGKSSSTTKGHGQITEESKSKARSYINEATSEHANKWMQMFPNLPCYIFKAGNLLTNTLHGLEIYNAVKYATGISENLSKTMAGYGHESAVHQVLNQLFTPDTGTIIEASKITNGSSENVPMISFTGAPIEDPSLLSMLSDAPLEPTAGKNQSFERGTKSLLRTLNYNKYSYSICAGLDAFNGIASLAYNVMGAIGIILSGGVATSIASYIISLVSSFAQFAWEGFFGSTVAAALQFLVPILASSIFSNLFDMMYSQPFGAELAKSFYVNGTRLSLNSGQSLSDEQAALEYNQVANNVLEQQAEVDRLTRSPLDITSKNTFLGSIIYKSIPLLIPGNSLTKSVTTIANATANSANQIAHLTSPNIANAAGAYYGYVPSYNKTFGEDCTALDRIFDDGSNNGGSTPAVGDVFCSPVTSFDKEAIETLPVLALTTPSNDSYIASNTVSDTNNLQDTTEAKPSVVADNLTADGKIKDGGNLSKYIKYCTQRQSPFGILDANIITELQGGSGLIGAAKGAISILTNPDYMGWATGSYCVNSAANPKWDSEFKYYQVYIADSRIIDFLKSGADTNSSNASTQQSAVAQYLDEYYYPTIPENETDAQFISRISGITIEDADFVLALVDYYHYLDNYDASTTIAMDGESTQMIVPTDTMISRVEDNKHIIYSSDTPTEFETQISVITPHSNIYANVRNRSFAVC